MISLQKINSRILSRQAGVSMVELLVAMLLGVFLLFALVEILINGKSSFGSANHMSRLQENGRIATNLLVTDLKRAGYMGGNSDPAGIIGTADQVAAVASTCANNDTSWGRMVTRPVDGLDDTNTGYACIPDATYLRGDVVTIRYAAPWVTTGAKDTNRLYLRSSLFEGRIFEGKDDAHGDNDIADLPQSDRELLAYSYFVGNSGRNCGDDAVPSLFRVRLNNSGQPTVDELLPGVENLQVQYSDGSQYFDADNVPDWDNIMTVRVWLLIRAECAETGFEDDRTYTMGDQVYDPPANDAFRRQVYSNVVLVRN